MAPPDKNRIRARIRPKDPLFCESTRNTKTHLNSSGMIICMTDKKRRQIRLLEKQ